MSLQIFDGLNSIVTIQSISFELINIERSELLTNWITQFDENLEQYPDTQQIAYQIIADHRDTKTGKLQKGLTLLWHTQLASQSMVKKLSSDHDHSSNNRPIQFYLDFCSEANQLRSFPAKKEGAFNQAIGRKSQRILDGSGGWGMDAFRLCTQGYQVTIAERHPIMALMLSDMFARLSISSFATNSAVCIPTVIAEDCRQVLNEENYDCVYFDPMFPPKRKKSAAVNKHMQLLQSLLAHENYDAEDVLAGCINQGAKRVAVKRPHYAKPLLQSPDQQFSSKLIHYDVYLES